jgi:hypothetical protein
MVRAVPEQIEGTRAIAISFLAATLSGFLTPREDP